MLIEILPLAIAVTAMGFCLRALRENAVLRETLAARTAELALFRDTGQSLLITAERLAAENRELYERMLRGGQPMYAAFEDGAEPVSTREADRRVVESRRPAGYEPIEVRDKTVEPPPRLTDSVGDEEDEG